MIPVLILLVIAAVIVLAALVVRYRRHRAAAERDEQVPVYTPALVALLLNREREKGEPLTEDEVLAIRDSATVVMTPASAAREMAQARGYDDLDPENCWAEWQVARREPR